MEQFVIHGGRQLAGELPVNGAKNHALKLIPACLLSKQSSTISNLPAVEDVQRLLEIVEEIGGVVKQSEDGRVATITPPTEFSGELDKELVTKLRASIVLIGPLLARFGRVHMPHPGGDNIGKRPINFFVDAFRALGATVEEHADHYIFAAPNGLAGTTIFFPSISVTGTETVMMAATQAKGTTILHNAACEPEIVALVEYLNSCGARIEGAGTHTLTIHGSDGMLLNGGEAHTIPDRIEAGSFIVLAGVTKSELTITNCNPTHLLSLLELFRHIGIPTTTTETSIQVHAPEGPLQGVDVVTHEYPGFPTDLQAPMTVLLTQTTGSSMVRETIYEGRLFYTDMLNTMGAGISLLSPYHAIVEGPTPLSGKAVASPDIRAGIAMVIAGLSAQGTTTIDNIYQIDRGYERIEQRLQAIGADITRVDS